MKMKLFPGAKPAKKPVPMPGAKKPSKRPSMPFKSGGKAKKGC